MNFLIPKKISWRRVFLTAILIIVFCVLVLAVYIFTGKAPSAAEINFGVTFSQLFSQQMGLDWQKNYLAILDDLKVKKLRLIAYWPLIEPEPGNYNFADLDWQIQEAEKRGAEVILALGRKLPRWPECHIPDWAKTLSESEQQGRVLTLIKKTVEYYREKDAIKIWQVENEPFLRSFGECPAIDKDFLKREVIAVREADSCQKRRPIMLTASGELSSWIETAIGTDILGTTLYRTIWNKFLGYFTYPLPPVFYYKRANLTRWMTGVEEIIVVELQGEPWQPKMLYETDIGQQKELMNASKLREIVDYTQQTGFDEAYWWGAEWWYWLKEKHQDDSLWQEAKKLWK